MTETELQELRECVWGIMGWTPWTEEEYPHRQGWSLLNGEGEKCLEIDMDDPTIDSAFSMEVLKKCIEKQGGIEIYDSTVSPVKCWTLRAIGKGNCFSQAETLELAICLFAQKLFSK